MSTSTVVCELEGIVLKKAPSSNSYSKLHLFTPEEGLYICLERTSKSPNKTQSDLFDTARIEIDPPKPGSYAFVKNYTLLHRTTRMAHNYTALADASFFSNIICINLTHNTDSQPHFALLQKAVSAWEEGIGIPFILIKSLYKFAQIEGYPVKQEWLSSLPQSLKEDAKKTLTLPLAKVKESAYTKELISHLVQWIFNKTDIKMPSKTTHTSSLHSPLL